MNWASTILLLLPLLAVTSSASRERNKNGRDDLHYSINEESAPGSLIANIVTDAGLHVLGVEALRSLRFKFLNQPTADGLTIDERTGVVSNTGRLDREALCAHDDTCQIRLDIAVQPMIYFQLVKVTSKIQNENIKNDNNN